MAWRNPAGSFTCITHGSSYVVNSQSSKWSAQIWIFALYGWKTCTRWRLDNLSNATQWFILQDRVETHEYLVWQSTRLTPCLYRHWPPNFQSFVWSGRIHSQLVSADDLCIVSWDLLWSLILSGLKSWLPWGQEMSYPWHQWVMINETKSLPVPLTRSLIYSL